MGQASSGRQGPFEAFAHRGFVVMWSGFAVSNIGSWLQNLAVPYVIFQATRSPRWVGLAGFAQFFPSVLSAPFGGVLSDRLERRRLLFGVQSLLTVSTTAIWISWVAGVASPTVLVLLVAVSGALSGLSGPTWHSVIAEIVPHEALQSALHVNGIQANVARAVGPALGGLILGSLGAGWAFGLNAVSFLAVLAALASLGLPPRGTLPERQVPRPFRAVVRSMWAHPSKRVAICWVVVFASLYNPVQQMVTPMVRVGLHRGAGAIGLLVACMGIGGIAGGLIGTHLTRPPRRALAALICLIVAGLSVAAFGAARSLAVAVATFLIGGFGYVIAMATFYGSVQMHASSDERGREMAILIVCFNAAYAFGSLGQGAVADAVGVRISLIGAGLLLAGLGVVGLRVGRGALDHVPAVGPEGGAH